MKKHIRISLVIPAYNEERYVRRCLEAVEAQTYQPYEVIVVDNNSTDHTVAIAREFPFVTLLQEKRQGLRFSRNTGLDAARGDIVARIDADTFVSPTWCERMAEAFADPQVMGVTGACYYHDMPGPQTSYVLDKSCRGLAFTIGKTLFYGSNMAMRKPLWRELREVACMEGEFFEDCDLSIHANELGHQITYVPDMIVGVSARRLDDSPLQFYRTMQEFDHTFDMHGMSSNAAQVAKMIYLSSFPFLKFVRMCYDAEASRFMLSRLLTSRAVARPTSNT